MPLEIDFDGHANHRIVIDDKDARHVVALLMWVSFSLAGKSRILLHAILSLASKLLLEQRGISPSPPVG
jgi:hypothetical protein